MFSNCTYIFAAGIEETKTSVQSVFWVRSETRNSRMKVKKSKAIPVTGLGGL
jgi:hypothetical protein